MHVTGNLKVGNYEVIKLLFLWGKIYTQSFEVGYNLLRRVFKGVFLRGLEILNFISTALIACILYYYAFETNYRKLNKWI